jgi:hypothetical protein
MKNRKDPFSSKHDTQDSIGAQYGFDGLDTGCGCSTRVGFDLSGGIDLGGLGDVANQAMGEAGSLYADAKDKVDAAIEMGQGVETAVQDLKSAGDEIADTIISVASSPVVHGALGILAVAAPPFSTLLAGIGEIGVGAVVATTELVRSLEGVFVDVFGSTEAKTAKAWGMSPEEVKKVLAYREQRAEARKTWEKNQAKATEQLAAIRAKALEGDREATAMMGILETFMQEDTLLLAVVARYGCSPEVAHIQKKGSATGLTPRDMCDVVKLILKDQERAAKMSASEFAHYSKLGRGVYTDKYGKRHGYDFAPMLGPNGGPSLDVNGQPKMAITDVATGKVIAEGQTAIKEWQKGFHFLINPKTRRANLTDALRLDIKELFGDTLLSKWNQVDQKATEEAEKMARRAINAALLDETRKAQAKKAAARLAMMKKKGIPVGVGATALGILMTKKDGKWKASKPGYYQIISDRSRGTARLVTETGRVVENYWQKVS